MVRLRKLCTLLCSLRRVEVLVEVSYSRRSMVRRSPCLYTLNVFSLLVSRKGLLLMVWATAVSTLNTETCSISLMMTNGVPSTVNPPKNEELPEGFLAFSTNFF